ncbi:MAG TPA: MlaD family protein, partial [Thermoanaerobaculia bacterium]|nr:MlaD family protein [Thermoanaerobaculia bacterium]
MRPEGSLVRVGALVLVGLTVLAISIFLVGERQFLFARKNSYYVEFENVSNLTVGNSVQLNGVNVGQVREVILPDDLGPTVRVWVTIDRRYEERIRRDSLARIQTLGLLGDKYIALNSGSPDVPVIEPGGRIAAAPATEIDQLLTSGGDVVDNLVVAASSLSTILARMERGEGLLGALVAESGEGQPLSETVTAIVTDLRDVLHDVKTGEGSLGRLIYDDRLMVELEDTITELQGLASAMNEGDGLLPALVNDTELRDRFASTLDHLDASTAELNQLIEELASSDGLL